MWFWPSAFCLLVSGWQASLLSHMPVLPLSHSACKPVLIGIPLLSEQITEDWKSSHFPKVSARTSFPVGTGFVIQKTDGSLISGFHFSSLTHHMLVSFSQTNFLLHSRKLAGHGCQICISELCSRKGLKWELLGSEFKIPKALTVPGWVRGSFLKQSLLAEVPEYAYGLGIVLSTLYTYLSEIWKRQHEVGADEKLCSLALYHKASACWGGFELSTWLWCSKPYARCSIICWL